jgi:hypothetical protein
MCGRKEERSRKIDDQLFPNVGLSGIEYIYNNYHGKVIFTVLSAKGR